MHKHWLLLLGLLDLALPLAAAEWAVGPRGSVGLSKDVSDQAVEWGPQWIYAGGLQAELDLGRHGFVGMELGVEQAGMTNAQSAPAVAGGHEVGEVQVGDYHYVEDAVAETLTGGLRGSWFKGSLQPMAYLGYQLTEALSYDQSFSVGGHTYKSTVFPDQDHRYRSYALLGLGLELGLGRHDSLALDLRVGQELGRQSSGGLVFAKAQLALSWLYHIGTPLSPQF